jgi:Fic family protein
MSNTKILLDKIDVLDAKLKALQPMNPEYQKKLDKKFRLEFNYNSNHIEGNTLTYSETELLLVFDDTTGNHTFREYEEMKSHDVAYHLVQEWANDFERPITEGDICNLNKTLLVKPFWKEAVTHDGQRVRRLIKVGEYKEQPNSVLLPNGEMFEYTSPLETPFEMQKLISWFRSETDSKELHPVALAALLHYKFVCIHPFDDGNGRVSRLLMNYVLFKNILPPVVIKSPEKRLYLSALNRADTGDLDAFIQYMAQQVIWSLELSIKAAKGESIEEADDFDKEIEMLKRIQHKPKEKIQKSSPVIRSTLQDVYFPLIKSLDNDLLKLNKLFKNHTWSYFEEPEPPEYGIPIIPKSTTIEDLIKYYYPNKIIRERSYHNFKAAYWLSEYNDQKEFSVEVSLKIFFNDTNFKVVVFIGQPYAGGLILEGINKILRTLSDDKKSPFDAYKDYTLFEADYDDDMTINKITHFSNQIRSETLDYIKLRVNEKQKE